MLWFCRKLRENFFPTILGIHTYILRARLHVTPKANLSVIFPHSPVKKRKNVPFPYPYIIVRDIETLHYFLTLTKTSIPPSPGEPPSCLRSGAQTGTDVHTYMQPQKLEANNTHETLKKALYLGCVRYLLQRANREKKKTRHFCLFPNR